MTKKILTFAALALLALSVASCQKLEARDNLVKGVRAFKAQKYDTAVERFKKALELDPELMNAQLYLATAYAQQFIPGNADEQNQQNATLAVSTFQKVLEKDPTNKTAISVIAGIYQSNNQYDKAREAYLKNAEVDPQNAIPFYAVGSINWAIVHSTESKLTPDEKGKLIDEGLQYLDKSMVINPDYEDSLWYENLLLREKAKLIDDQIKVTKDKNAQKELASQSADLKAKADDWSTRALAVRKKNADKKSGPGGIDINK